MAHLYKASEWEDLGRWYVNDVTDSGVGGKWWTPMRLLGLSPQEYIYLLKDTFHASHFYYKAQFNVLQFSFDTITDARKFKNYINKKAREKNFIV